MSDPIQDLTHDHGDINRRVLALSAAVAQAADVLDYKNKPGLIVVAGH